MLRGKTETGFEFEIPDDILDDYELLEMLCQIDEGEPLATVKMVDKLLGKEQKERLKAHVKDLCGKVSAEKLLEEVGAILNSCNQGKNC